MTPQKSPSQARQKVIWNCDRCVAFDVHVQKIYVSVYRQVYTGILWVCGPISCVRLYVYVSACVPSNSLVHCL